MPNPENLVNWKPGQSGNPKGRPKKFATTLKENGYKIGEINATLQNLLALNAIELREIIKDDDATILEAIVAKMLIKAKKSGDMRGLETLLSRVFGHPKQSFEATITEQPIFPEDENDRIYSNEEE